MIEKLLKAINHNYLYVVWFILYFFLAWIMFGLTIPGLLFIILAYIVSLSVAFSPLGEKIMILVSGIRPIETKREMEYLEPLFEELYSTAKEIHPDLPEINLNIIDTMTINACAVGMHTIAVTKGAIETFSEEELKGILGHEIGHIYHMDTLASLLTVVGNGIFALIIIPSKIMLFFLDLLLQDGRGRKNIIIKLVGLMLQLIMFVFVYLGQVITSINSRKNELAADKFSYDLGYGDDLISALYLLQNLTLTSDLKITERITLEHPRTSKRIQQLELLTDM